MNEKKVKGTPRGNRNNRSEHKKRQEEKILRVSGRLFWQKGYLGTSVDDIAQAARINKASIYYHFKNKNQLLYEIAIKVLEELFALVTPVINADIEPEDKLSLLITNHMQVELSNPGLAGIGQQERRNLTPALMRSFIGMRDDYEAIFCQVISDIIEKNKLQITDAKLTTMFVLGMMNSITQWYKASGKLSKEEMTQQAIDFIFRAMMIGEKTA